MNRLEEILFDSNEKIVSVLGINTIQKFLSTGIFGNGFAVLSEKRLYFRGKCLYKKYEEKAVYLKDVTGTGFEHIKPISLLIAGIACVAVTVLLLLILISR